MLVNFYRTTSTTLDHCKSTIYNINQSIHLCNQLGTTVFCSKFFQIPRASLWNSAAHCSKFSTYANL